MTTQFIWAGILMIGVLKIWNNVRMLLWLTCLTGIIYPLLITAIAQLTMKQKADGDFLLSQEKIVGARLIAQKFESDKYFWARPSSIDYNPLPSISRLNALRNQEELIVKILKTSLIKKW
jgi:K+-transporting ATPase c subunit